ncbi:MAG: hypothetical protein P8168_14585 [Deltaproteobacteria bacterium]
MNKKIISIAAIAIWCFGCAAGTYQGENNLSRTPLADATVAKAPQPNELVFDPGAVDTSALPHLRDLPIPSSLKNREKAKPYTGIIKNKTRYKVSIPSLNSDATLVIPPYSWIEFTAWSSKFGLTVYHNGKPFYCLNIFAHPKVYSFMCKKYDFMAEIVKPEPVIRHWPSKLKRRKIKRRSTRPPC